MPLNELVYGCDNLIFELGRALRDPHSEIVQFLAIGFQSFAVANQNREQGGNGDSFVTILKRMILDHEVEKNAGLGDKRWVQGLARESLKRGNHTALKHIWKPGREIRYWLSKRKVSLRESKGKVLNVC